VVADGLAHGRPWFLAAYRAARPHDVVAYRGAAIMVMERRVAASHDPARLASGI
jgi:hypothetical protein